MRPLNKKHFGTNGLEVSFFNGTEVVTGYVLKQLAASRYVVRTAGDATPRHVRLVNKTTLGAGEAVIYVLPHGATAPAGLKKVREVHQNYAMGFDGVRYQWTDVATVRAGQARIEKMPVDTGDAVPGADDSELGPDTV